MRLKKEFKYYVDHQDELVAKYNGKVLVIKDQTVLGVYDSELKAVENTKKDFPIGTFLVQKCVPGKSSFHSRVVFDG